ncbi:unnamed protein product, partial [Polarella glacialis]
QQQQEQQQRRMSVISSPALPLLAALVAVNFLIFVAWSPLVFISLGVASAWAIRSCWRWWDSLVITIEGVLYKTAGFQAGRNRSQGTASSTTKLPKTGKGAGCAGNEEDGFLTPRSESEAIVGCDVVEWAPFAPSFPLGDAPGKFEGALGRSLSGVLRGGGSSSSTAGAQQQQQQQQQPRQIRPAQYWLPCEASVFDIRNIRYKQTREKISSEFALYQCVGMDMIRDRRKIASVIDRLPEHAELPKSLLGSREWSSSWGVPRVLITNCQLPYKAGRLIGSHPEEDGGLSILSYFVLSAETSALLADGKFTAALRLWKRFVEEGVSTKEGISLKVVGRVEDLDRYDVPESFKGFNNKPVLLTKSATVLSHKLPEVLEIDFDVRSWIYPARSALANYHHRTREAAIQVGYVLEGKTDDELPEQILGCFRVHELDITAAHW